MNITTGIPSHYSEDVVNLLNILLSDESALYKITRNAQWNVIGPNFYEFHKFFQIQYEAIEATINDISERIRSF